MDRPCLWWQPAAGDDLFSAAKEAGDDQMQPLYAGAMSGIPGAGAVVQQLVAQARACL